MDTWKFAAADMDKHTYKKNGGLLNLLLYIKLYLRSRHGGGSILLRVRFALTGTDALYTKFLG